MNDLLAQLSNPTLLLVPLVYSLATLVLLWLVFRLLRRVPRVYELRALYWLGTILLALTLLLDGEGLLTDALTRNLLLGALLICWGYVLFELIEQLLVERMLLRRGVLVARLARDIVRVTVLVALLLLVINQIFAVPLSSLVISSTVLSAVLGLALQDLLKDMIAGVALQAEQPFAPGHWIQVQGRTGKVVEMSWRATRLVTVDNTHVILPNAILAQAEISNYTLVSPLQALHVQVAVAYHHPPNEVKQVLIAAALAAPGVLPAPLPRVRLVQYGEYSLTYDIKFWLTDFDNEVEIRNSVMTNAWYFLKRASIRLPVPVRDIYVHQADPSHSEEARRSQIERSLQTLAHLDLFAVLSSDERALLAQGCELRMYGVGEVLVRQGEPGDALFIIQGGQVRIEASDQPGSAPVVLDRLGAGEFFGELALLTGEPRGATVVAEADTTALVVRHAAIGPLFDQNPALAEGLSAVLEQRLAANRSTMAEHRQLTPTNGEDLSQPGLLRRIRALFGV